MKVHEPLSSQGTLSWRDRLMRLGGAPVEDARLRDEIHSLLMRWRAGVIAATACSVVTWTLAWVTLDADWPAWFIAADIALVVAKWSIVSDKALDDRVEREKAIGKLMLLSAIWAMLLGLGIALCMASGNTQLSTVAVGVGAGVIGTVTFRNAPTPGNARLLILCVVIPPALAGYFLTDGTLSLLWVCLIPWCASLFVMIGQNYEVIKQASLTRIELHQAARTDPLTGLQNRLAFYEFLRRPGPQRTTLLYLDLDDFKSVNDAYGHEAGDSLLVEMATRIKCAVRGCDTVFRLGGDEFAVVIADLPAKEVEARAQAMVEQAAKPFEVTPGVIASVGLSVGSAELVGAGLNAADAVRAADRALYRAKAEGKGRYIGASASA